MLKAFKKSIEVGEFTFIIGMHKLVTNSIGEKCLLSQFIFLILIVENLSLFLVHHEKLLVPISHLLFSIFSILE